MTDIRTLTGEVISAKEAAFKHYREFYKEIDDWTFKTLFDRIWKVLDGRLDAATFDFYMDNPPVKCFWCMDPIKGEIKTFNVKSTFCHHSYWEKGEYGALDDDGETGYLYSCSECDENITEGYDFCSGCGLLFNDSDLAPEAMEDGELMCRECWLEEQGFEIERSYHKTDAWRGHMTAEGQGITVVAAECCIVPHNQNEEIIEATEEWLQSRGFETLHYAEPTSNLFSVNLIILAKKNPMTEEDRERLSKVDHVFVNFYTRGFSIFSGTTSPIDMEAYRQALEGI